VLDDPFNQRLMKSEYVIQTNERQRKREIDSEREIEIERKLFPVFPKIVPGCPKKFPVSENCSSRTNFPSRNSGGKNRIYPSRSRKRERENYGV
jgi:hypothetical protein